MDTCQFSYGGHEYEYSWSGYYAVSFMVSSIAPGLTSYHFRIPDDPLWAIHPESLRQWAELGLKMETYGDVLRWLNDTLDEQLDADIHYWMRECTSGFRYVKAPVQAISEVRSGASANTVPVPDEGPDYKWVLNDRLSEDTPLLAFDDEEFEHTADLDEEDLGSRLSLLSFETSETRAIVGAIGNPSGDTYRDSTSWFHKAATPPVPEGVDKQYYRKMNYTFTPEDLPFLKTKKEKHRRYFGMEIEVSSTITPTELQIIVTEVEPKQELFFYMKDDTSIRGKYGQYFEIVTVPMTPRRMKREWHTLFKKLERLCSERGVDLEDVFDMSEDLNNGIHIHVNNKCFVSHAKPTKYKRGRSFHKNRFLTAFNQWDTSFQVWMKKVSKRPYEGRRSEYFPPHPCFDGLTVARRLSQGQTHDEHRSACHDNGRTTEVRVFYGLFDLKHIFSCIEFTDAMIDFTHNAPISAFGSRFVPKFTSWLDRQPGYRNAKEVLKACA